MANLFRREVLESHRQAWLGTVQLTRPVPLWVATGFVLGVAILVGAFLWTGEYTRKARVTGFLAPDRGVIRLVAPQAATVVEAHAREGQRVRQGDALFVLDVGQSSPRGDTQAAVESSLAARQRSLRGSSAQQSELEAARLAALDRRIEAMQRELGPLRRGAGPAAQARAARRGGAGAVQGVPRRELRLRRPGAHQVRGAVRRQGAADALERQRAAHLREIAALQAERRELPLRARAAQGEIERDLAALAQQAAENAARQRIVVRAPQDGTVSAVRRRGRADA